MADLLSSSRDFSAVLAANDLIALGAIDQLRESGLACPQDRPVVGFNDMLFANRFNPTLTTVHVPFYEIGTEAAHMLLDQLGGSKTMRKTMSLPTTLKVRGSSGPVGYRAAATASISTSQPGSSRPVQMTVRAAWWPPSRRFSTATLAGSSAALAR